MSTCFLISSLHTVFVIHLAANFIYHCTLCVLECDELRLGMVPKTKTITLIPEEFKVRNVLVLGDIFTEGVIEQCDFVSLFLKWRQKLNTTLGLWWYLNIGFMYEVEAMISITNKKIL